MNDPLELIEAWQQGTLNDQQAAALAEWLRDPVHAETFAREAFIHQRLRDVLHNTDVYPIEAHKMPTMRRSRSIWFTGALAAAILLAVSVWFVFYPAANKTTPVNSLAVPVAMLSDYSEDAVFTGTSQPMNLGEGLSRGPARLASGGAQVMFKSGAVVDLIGPCEFELTGPNRGHLTSGYVSVFVPSGAAGFTIETASQRFIDMGTRFILWTTPADGATLHVLEGMVMVEDRAGGSSGQTLRRGQAWSRANTSAPSQISSFVVDDQSPARLNFEYHFGTGMTMPTFNWDASLAGGEPSTWSSHSAQTGQPLSWHLRGLPTGERDTAPAFVDVTGSSSLPITRACRFAGGFASAVIEHPLPGRNENMTLELVVKPTDLVGREILFEAGGDANGFSLLLDGVDLKLRLDEDNVADLADDRSLEATHRLSKRDIADYMQIAAVIDLDNDRIELFVNGRSVAATQPPHHGTPAGNLRGWGGGNTDALGSANAYGNENIGGDDQDDLRDFTAFDGWITAVRFYQNQCLTPTQIQSNYQAMRRVPRARATLLKESK